MSKCNLREHLLAVKISKADYANLVKASEIDGRKIPDFVRHYLKATVDAMLSISGQRQVLKLFSDEKTVAKMLKEMSKDS